MQLGAKLLGILVNDVEVDLAEYGYHGYAASYFERYRQSDDESTQRSA